MGIIGELLTLYGIIGSSAALGWMNGKVLHLALQLHALGYDWPTILHMIGTSPAVKVWGS